MSDEAGKTAPRRRTRVEIEQIAAEFSSSGLTRTEFCRRRGMSLGSLNRYLKQGREDAKGATNDGLVAVEVAGTKLAIDRDTGCGLAVVFPGGRSIAVEPGFDTATLRRLILLLEQM